MASQFIFPIDRRGLRCEPSASTEGGPVDYRHTFAPLADDDRRLLEMPESLIATFFCTRCLCRTDLNGQVLFVGGGNTPLPLGGNRG